MYSPWATLPKLYTSLHIHFSFGLLVLRGIVGIVEDEELLNTGSGKQAGLTIEWGPVRVFIANPKTHKDKPIRARIEIQVRYWRSRTRILSLFRRRTIPVFNSDAEQAT